LAFLLAGDLVILHHEVSAAYNPHDDRGPDAARIEAVHAKLDATKALAEAVSSLAGTFVLLRTAREEA